MSRTHGADQIAVRGVAEVRRSQFLPRPNRAVGWTPREGTLSVASYA